MLRPAAIVELARAIACARGLEIGGLLLEEPSGAQRIQLAPNLQTEPGSFEAPRWWFDARIGRCDLHGYRPVAFIHSHGSSLDLSDVDRESLRGSTLPWIVVCVDSGRLAWTVHRPTRTVELPQERHDISG
jgi:proteasome lid subunit RPN8/RPN11